MLKRFSPLGGPHMTSNETSTAARRSGRRAQRLLGAEARYQAIVDTAVDAIVVIDERGVVSAFNPAAERLFGYDAAEIIGRNVKVLMPAPHHGAHDGYLSR